MSNAPVIDRAIAHYRRECWRAASGMTTSELRACEPAYRAQVAGPVTGEALVQLRMIRTIVSQRVRSTRARSRAALEFQRTRAGR
jgi:hypothetical protein